MQLSGGHECSHDGVTTTVVSFPNYEVRQGIVYSLTNYQMDMF